VSDVRLLNLHYRDDGRLYALEPWPARTQIAIVPAWGVAEVKIKGKEVTIRCANGEAQYVMRRSLHHGWAWECELAHSTFRAVEG
jgi:hypothetical protein